MSIRRNSIKKSIRNVHYAQNFYSQKTEEDAVKAAYNIKRWVEAVRNSPYGNDKKLQTNGLLMFYNSLIRELAETA